MTLPEDYLSAFGSPVPIILGISQDLQYLKDQEIESKLTNFIIVSLDDDNILMTSKVFNEIMISYPQFGNYKEKLKSLYYLINSEPSNNFPHGGKSLKQIKKNSCTKKNKETNDNNKKLIYTSTIREETACEKILELLKEIIDCNIVNKIPKPIKYINKERNVFYIF